MNHMVTCVRVQPPVYSTDAVTGAAGSPVVRAVSELLAAAGLDAERHGTSEWNPLGELIPEGARVVLKPNWVHHENHSGSGTDCLVTHTSVVEAVARYAARARPSSLIIGDAPIQGCDFDRLGELIGIEEMLRRLHSAGVHAEVRDFRQRVLRREGFGRQVVERRRAEEDYVLFDLGGSSALEPVTSRGAEFRVTMYDPRHLRRTHAPGRHQYLVAREVIEADVVINLPKLKTHKKACVTGALKNLVGINGLKDYLPHHRKGGSEDGGDCYEGASMTKRAAEGLLDAANEQTGAVTKRLLAAGARMAVAAGTLVTGDSNIEGSWYGNDTVWRMCLDLQRVLHYGTLDGRLADSPTRRVITITDAIIAGEGNGPLAPTPIPLGMLTFATNTAAAEWVHAFLMGIDPRKVPLIVHAFDEGPWPLAGFRPDEIQATVGGVRLRGHHDLAVLGPRPFVPPTGWEGNCELSPVLPGPDGAPR